MMPNRRAEDVTREIVFEDYLLSNGYDGTVERIAATARDRNVSPNAVRPLLMVDRSYRETALRAIDVGFGSLDNYRRVALGLSDQDPTRLRVPPDTGGMFRSTLAPCFGMDLAQEGDGMMRGTLALFFGLILVSQGNVPGRAPANREDSAVREVVKKYIDARERRDVEALRALFTEDADQLVSSGEWRKGREEIVRGTLASSAQTGGTRTITVQNVRFPVRDVAIADGPYEIAGGQDTAARKMWSSFVMIRTAGTWRISAIRNMLPAPPTAPAAK